MAVLMDLLERYSNTDLKGVLLRLPDGTGLVNALSATEVSPDQYSVEVAVLLKARALVDDRLFDELLRLPSGPPLKAQIEETRALWRSPRPAPAPETAHPAVHRLSVTATPAVIALALTTSLLRATPAPAPPAAVEAFIADHPAPHGGRWSIPAALEPGPLPGAVVQVREDGPPTVEPLCGVTTRPVTADTLSLPLAPHELRWSRPHADLGVWSTLGTLDLTEVHRLTLDPNANLTRRCQSFLNEQLHRGASIGDRWGVSEVLLAATLRLQPRFSLLQSALPWARPTFTDATAATVIARDGALFAEVQWVLAYRATPMEWSLEPAGER
ncbi:MAG: hypothetical protein H6739_12415 [Alphaproteobacteria bacterium]|nr:hypothetical protein [Alphaproteobacteria bacterium]